MKHMIIITTALLLLASFNAEAARPPSVLEDGRELSASMLTLPAANGGELVIKGCTACKIVALRLSPAAQFYIGKQEVTYVDFKRHVLTHPTANVLVVSPLNQPVVTRIRASAS